MNVEKRRPVWMFLEIRTHHMLHDDVANASKTECILKGKVCTLREVGGKQNFRKTGHCFPVWVRLLDYMHAKPPSGKKSGEEDNGCDA
jgi:hypothetical protein